MIVTIATDKQYKESTKKGVGHKVKAPAKTLARWRKVLEEYQKVQGEISQAYETAIKEFFAGFEQKSIQNKP